MVQTLCAVLDHLSPGVAIVAGQGRIVYANEAARGMLRDGANIRARNGRLAGASREATLALLRAIRTVQDQAAAGAGSGVGVPLPGSDGGLVTAHVAPLPSPSRHPGERQRSEATVAVFITRASETRPGLAVIAASYRLTPAEVRLLVRLLAGETVAEAAAALDVGISTARSHLKRLFAKTGTLRQSDLLTLVHRLTPPLRDAQAAAYEAGATGSGIGANGLRPIAPCGGIAGQRQPTAATR